MGEELVVGDEELIVRVLGIKGRRVCLGVKNKSLKGVGFQIYVVECEGYA